MNIYQRLLILATAFTSFAVFAAQNGLVVSDKAVIYADVNMKHPIGTLSRWKQVRTGSVARNGGRVLPIKVSENKIAYIDVNDLSFGRDSRAINATFAKFNADITTVMPKKDHLHLLSSGFLGNAHISDDEFGTNEVNTNFYGFGFEHIKHYTDTMSWYYGVSYEQSIAGDGVSLTNLMIRLGGKYKLFKYKDFVIGANANVGVAPYAAIKTDYFLAKGYNMSHSAGLDIYVPLTSYLDFTVFGGYEVQKLFGLDLPAGLGEFNPYIVGYKMNFGLAFYY